MPIMGTISFIAGQKQTNSKGLAKKKRGHSPLFLTLANSLTHTSACFLRLVMAPTRPRPASIWHRRASGTAVICRSSPSVQPGAV